MSAEQQKQAREGVGILTRLVVIVLAFIGLWVVLGQLYDWAHPWWRYASVASISFAIGAMYGRFRRWERDEKRKSSS